MQLDSLNMNHIIGAKPTYHQLLFDWIKSKGLKKYEFIGNQGVENNLCGCSIRFRLVGQFFIYKI